MLSWRRSTLSAIVVTALLIRSAAVDHSAPTLAAAALTLAVVAVLLVLSYRRGLALQHSVRCLDHRIVAAVSALVASTSLILVITTVCTATIT